MWLSIGCALWNRVNKQTNQQTLLHSIPSNAILINAYPVSRVLIQRKRWIGKEKKIGNKTTWLKLKLCVEVCVTDRLAAFGTLLTPITFRHARNLRFCIFNGALSGLLRSGRPKTISYSLRYKRRRLKLNESHPGGFYCYKLVFLGWRRTRNWFYTIRILNKGGASRPFLPHA